jgi:serine protease Do
MERDISLTLGELPAEAQSRRDGEGAAGALEGLPVEELTPQLAQQLGVPIGTQGVVAVQVSPTSAAFEAGLRRGDVIQEVNRRPIASVPEFERAVRQAGKETILLRVNRGGSTLFLAIEP